MRISYDLILSEVLSAAHNHIRQLTFLLSSLITAITWPGWDDWSQDWEVLLSVDPPGSSSQAEIESLDTTPTRVLPDTSQGMSVELFFIQSKVIRSSFFIKLKSSSMTPTCFSTAAAAVVIKYTRVVTSVDKVILTSKQTFN